MKSYEEVAQNVLRRRDEYEYRKKQQKIQMARRLSAAMSMIAVVTALLLSAGTCYVFAAGLGIIDDFLGIFTDRTDAPLSTSQQQFLEDAIAEIGESVTCNGYTVTAKGAFTDGTVAYILLEITAPEGTDIAQLGVGFDTEYKGILRGDNPAESLGTTGLGIACIPAEDTDGKSNTASVLLQVSCVRMNGSSFSFADGYARYLQLEDIQYYLKEYPYSRTVLCEGTWNFKILFNEVYEQELELLSAPVRRQIQRMTLTDYVSATVSSVRLKGMGVLFYYTIDASDVQEAGDFGAVEIHMKDGSVVNAYPRVATTVGEDSSGNRQFCCYCITLAPVIFEDVAYVTVGNDWHIPLPDNTRN